MRMDISSRKYARGWPEASPSREETMDRHCNHNIPETKKGIGPCNIQWEVKKRNGKPNWWCRTQWA